MDLQLSGKRVFVTGASKGIGLAVARAFRQEGARVAINSSNPQNLARAQEVLGGDCLTLGGDLGDIDSIGSIFAQLEERWGGLDILVNNAAVMVRTPLLEIEPAQWDKIMNTNLRGAFFCAQAAARLMMRQGRCDRKHIVQCCKDADLRRGGLRNGERRHEHDDHGARR